MTLQKLSMASCVRLPREIEGGLVSIVVSHHKRPPAKAVSGRWKVASLINQAGEASGLPFSTT